MIWLTGIIGFAIGMCVGAVLFKQFKSDTVKVRQLEEKLQAMQTDHDDYKHMVHSHFTTTAELVHNLTDSYRDVYNHLASGAQSLCPDNISNQLALASDNRDILSSETEAGTAAATEEENPDPPRDYGAMKGNLSEEYGLNRAQHSEETSH